MRLFTVSGSGARIEHGDIGDYRRRYTEERYVPPDEDNIEICLNCTKSKCKGWCEKINKAKPH